MTTTTNLCERLRKVDKSIWFASVAKDSERLWVGQWSHEAADEIERLQEAVKAAHGATVILAKEVTYWQSKYMAAIDGAKDEFPDARVHFGPSQTK